MYINYATSIPMHLKRVLLFLWSHIRPLMLKYCKNNYSRTKSFVFVRSGMLFYWSLNLLFFLKMSKKSVLLKLCLSCCLYIVHTMSDISSLTNK